MRHALLAILADAPAHGYELKQGLDERLGSTLPPLNAGQVYTTLQRLERDGLVVGTDVPEDARNKRVYPVTDRGRETLNEWLRTPVSASRLRDELFVKLTLAGSTTAAATRTLIDIQRRATLQALRALDERADRGSTVADLLAEGAALHLEADLRWLDLCERRLGQEDDNGNRNQR